VLVDELDDEHEACAAALATLAEARDAAALRGVIAAYDEHFAHEEQLLEEHVYAGVGASDGGFSALAGQRKSHFGDHARLLASLRDGLTSLPAGGKLPGAFVSQVLRDFEAHAGKYDSTYAEPLAAALGTVVEAQ